MKILFVGKNEFTCVCNWFLLQQQLCLYQEYPILKNGRLISVVFSFLSPYIYCLSFWRKLESCLIILLYYRGKNNSVPGNAAMPTSIPFQWFSQLLEFAQILLIARNQSILTIKITWKLVSALSRRKWVRILSSKSFISALGYIPPLVHFRFTGYVQGWILEVHSKSASCRLSSLHYIIFPKNDCLISFILSTKVYWEKWLNAFFTFIILMTFPHPKQKKHEYKYSIIENNTECLYF